MYRKSRSWRNRKTNWWPVFIGCLAIGVAVGVVLIETPKEPPGVKVEQQEFTKFRVVQYYFHLPSGDIIVGRKNAKFNELMEVTRKTVTSITAKQPSPLTGPGVQAKVCEIQRQSISLSIWLPNPEKISTRIPAKDKESADKYGNRFFETDRLLIVFGGPYQGQVFSRIPGQDEWLSWQSSNESMRQLVEIIRSGDL